MSELGAGELPVPAFRSERLAKNRLSGRLLRFSLAADVSFKVGSLPPKRNDLDDWGPTFQHMQSIRPGCEEQMPGPSTSCSKRSSSSNYSRSSTSCWNCCCCCCSNSSHRGHHCDCLSVHRSGLHRCFCRGSGSADRRQERGPAQWCRWRAQSSGWR